MLTTSKHILNAKIAVLYQNDDFGKEYLTDLREGLSDKADKMLGFDFASNLKSGSEVTRAEPGASTRANSSCFGTRERRFCPAGYSLRSVLHSPQDLAYA